MSRIAGMDALEFKTNGAKTNFRTVEPSIWPLVRYSDARDPGSPRDEMQYISVSRLSGEAEFVPTRLDQLGPTAPSGLLYGPKGRLTARTRRARGACVLVSAYTILLRQRCQRAHAPKLLVPFLLLLPASAQGSLLGSGASPTFLRLAL